MHTNYADILEKISEPPRWFDECAVPRFCAFAPDECSDIYADEAVLAEVTCQSCGHRFSVAFTQNKASAVHRNRSLADDIRERTLHYGDPPNIGCCAAGPTMNSEPRLVVEYWSRHHREFVRPGGQVADVPSYFSWRRAAALEIRIEPDWVVQADKGTIP